MSQPRDYATANLLPDGNVLILGIYAKTIENESSSIVKMRKNQKYDKYSTYLYDRASNMFYKTDSPKFPIFKGVGIVKLKNGDIDCCSNSAFEHLYNELIEIHNIFLN